VFQGFIPKINSFHSRFFNLTSDPDLTSDLPLWKPRCIISLVDRCKDQPTETFIFNDSQTRWSKTQDFAQEHGCLNPVVGKAIPKIKISFSIPYWEAPAKSTFLPCRAVSGQYIRRALPQCEDFLKLQSSIYSFLIISGSHNEGYIYSWVTPGPFRHKLCHLTRLPSSPQLSPNPPQQRWCRSQLLRREQHRLCNRRSYVSLLKVIFLLVPFGVLDLLSKRTTNPKF
jgi:hypothetical protein